MSVNRESCQSVTKRTSVRTDNRIATWIFMSIREFPESPVCEYWWTNNLCHPTLESSLSGNCVLFSFFNTGQLMMYLQSIFYTVSAGVQRQPQHTSGHGTDLWWIFFNLISLRFCIFFAGQPITPTVLFLPLFLLTLSNSIPSLHPPVES